MAASSTVTNKAGKVIQNIELAASAAAYNANPTGTGGTPTDGNCRAHERAMMVALIASGDLPITSLG